MSPKVIGVWWISLLGLAVSSPAAAQVWERICREGEVCSVHGTKPLRFGAGDKFNYGVATNTVNCSRETFGDPAPGVAKSCYAYFTTKETAVLNSLDKKDERVKALQEQVELITNELTEANAELDDLYRELRRERRRDSRRERRNIRIEEFGPFIRELRE